MKLKIAFLLVPLIFILSNINVRASVSSPDSLALVSLYNSTNGNNWFFQNNWLTGEVSTWYGVFVSDGHVSELQLSNNNLIGSIPSEIGDLSYLTLIELENNQLTGSIPTEIGLLEQLQQLYLSGNQLSGSIPSSLGALGKLKILMLDDNLLDGSIPDTIWSLVSLTIFSLQSNQLSGSISAEIKNLSKLETFEAGLNNLTGNIPPEIGQLSALSKLDLSSNQLSDSIPPEIWQLSNMAYLELSGNELTGPVPSAIGQLTKLQFFSVKLNRLTGVVPEEIGQMSKLTYLNLCFNQFSGYIPDEIQKMKSIETFDFSFNKLGGDFPDVIDSLPVLKKLVLCGNHFKNIPNFSNIDSSITCYYNNLTFEDFEKNLDVIRNKNVFFEYSPQYKLGREYDTTAIKGHSFSLNIPCGGEYNHYKWYKDDVLISGAPDTSEFAISSFQASDTGSYNVVVVNDSVTELELASYPVHVDMMLCLERDSLALVNLYNSTDGANWSKSDNWLAGPVSTWYGVAVDGCNVVKVELDSNNLDGELPSSMGEMYYLDTLSLNHNHLSGSLPDELWDITLLTDLDLGNNNFVGNISEDINRLTLLETFNIENNWFEEIPDLPDVGSVLNCSVNLLTFEDFERNLDLIRQGDHLLFIYSPQRLFGKESDTTLVEGNSLTLSILCGGKYNHYQWYKDSILMGESPDSSSLFLSDLTLSDAGDYYIVVTNDSVTDLTLYSFPIHLTVLPAIELIYPEDGAESVSLDVSFVWETASWADSYTLQISTSPDFSTLDVSQSGLDSSTFLVNGLAENTTYYWKVTGTSSSGLNGTSAIWSFTTKQETINVEPVNLIIVDGVHQTQFIVSGIEDFPNNRLSVFTRWGKVIYEKTGYQNEFDMSSYHAGTYYYVLTVESETEQKQIKGFVQLVKN